MGPDGDLRMDTDDGDTNVQKKLNAIFSNPVSSDCLQRGSAGDFHGVALGIQLSGLPRGRPRHSKGI